MRMRESELEKECSHMRQEIEKLGRAKGESGSTAWGNVSKKLWLRMKSQMYSAQKGSVSSQNNQGKVKERHGKFKKNSSLERINNFKSASTLAIGRRSPAEPVASGGCRIRPQSTGGQPQGH
ncbi:hypothetical protein CDL15_Pgr011237 [Punica granatum]|nr:hypothetical protein CDL15_Pgr011237 [Punica granatum]